MSSFQKIPSLMPIIKPDPALASIVDRLATNTSCVTLWTAAPFLPVAAILEEPAHIPSQPVPALNFVYTSQWYTADTRTTSDSTILSAPALEQRTLCFRT